MYEKSQVDVAERRAAAALEIVQMLGQPLTRARLAKLIDLVRLSMDDETIRSLLVKVHNELPYKPKEAVYLETLLAG